MFRAFLILFLFLPLNGQTQFKKQFDFEPSNYVAFDDYGGLSFTDSIDQSYDDRIEVSMPKLPMGKLGTSIVSYQVGVNKKGNFLELINFGDTLFLYRQYISKEHRPFGLLYEGALVKGDYSEDYSDMPLSDEYGEPLMKKDSSDYLYPQIIEMVPDDLWKCHIDSSIYQMGNFNLGKREGVWNTYSSELRTSKKITIIESNEFINGKLINKIDFNILNQDLSKKKKEKELLGKWYNTGLSHSDKSRMSYRNYAYFIFSRDSMDFSRSYYNILDFIDFKKDKTFNKKTSASCGVGFKGNEPLRKKEWYFDEKGRLVIDGYLYQLVFLSNEQMILRINY